MSDIARRPEMPDASVVDRHIRARQAKLMPRQIWAPPTKRRLDAIAPVSPELHSLLTRIFCSDDSTSEKLRLAHLALPLVFDPSS